MLDLKGWKRPNSIFLGERTGTIEPGNFRTCPECKQIFDIDNPKFGGRCPNPECCGCKSENSGLSRREVYAYSELWCSELSKALIDKAMHDEDGDYHDGLLGNSGLMLFGGRKVKITLIVEDVEEEPE